MAQNVISLLFAGAVIGINIAFIQNPYRCFFTAGICDTLSWSHSVTLPWGCTFDENSEECQNTRLALIKGQLAAGVVMAVTCIIYLIMYFVAASRAKANRHQTQTIVHDVMAPVPSQPYVPHPQPSAPVMMPAPYNNPGYLPPNQYPTLYPQINNERF